MNVQQMLPEIRKKYPSARIVDNFESAPYDLTQVILENGWKISLGYGKKHSCDTSRGDLEDPAESATVEVAIYYPSGRWYIPEGASVGHRDTTAVLSWQDSEQVFRILEYISAHEGGVQCQDTGGS